MSVCTWVRLSAEHDTLGSPLEIVQFFALHTFGQLEAVCPVLIVLDPLWSPYV